MQYQLLVLDVKKIYYLCKQKYNKHYSFFIHSDFTNFSKIIVLIFVVEKNYFITHLRIIEWWSWLCMKTKINKGIFGKNLL